MSAADRIDRICGRLNEALVEVEELKGEVPAFCLEPARYLKAEIAVIGRRLENMKKVLVGTSRIARPEPAPDGPTAA